MIEIRDMSQADLSQGHRLSQQAGWNQTLEDWRNLFGLADGLAFVAARGEDVLGTVMVLPQDVVGWVAMMLVDPRERRQGLGRALMEQCLHAARQWGFQALGLDATALGQPLYERLGFTAHGVIQRHGGRLLHPDPSVIQPSAAESMRGVQPFDRQRLIELDRDVHGRDRSAWMDLLLGARGFEVRTVRDDRDECQAFIATRPGRVALQIGPCVAKIESVGVQALASTCARLVGESVWIDVLEDQPAYSAVTSAFSLRVHRLFTRMWCWLEEPRPVVESFPSSGVTGGPDFG